MIVFKKSLIALLTVMALASPIIPKVEIEVPVLIEETEETLKVYGLEIFEIEEEEVEEDFRKVKFTNFYTGDGTGSGPNTSVGLSTKDFDINSKGWYTYKGKVVIATATALCLEVKSGPCGKYNSVPEGYEVHDLWDELDIEFEGTQYRAVVLSSCGACFWDEEVQRVDIFVAPTGRFGTKIGGVQKVNEN